MGDSDDVPVISKFPDSDETSIDISTNGCTTGIEETTNQEYTTAILAEGENESITLGGNEYKNTCIHDTFPDLPADLLGDCSFPTGNYPSEPSPDSVTYSLNVVDDKIPLSGPVPWPDDDDDENDYGDLMAISIVIVGTFVAP